MVLPLQDQNVSQCEILNTIATRKTLIQYYGNVLLHPVNNFKVWCLICNIIKLSLILAIIYTWTGVPTVLVFQLHMCVGTILCFVCCCVLWLHVCSIYENFRTSIWCVQWHVSGISRSLFQVRYQCFTCINVPTWQVQILKNCPLMYEAQQM